MEPARMYLAGLEQDERETLSRIGREGELAFDLRRIRDENRRRPKLIEILDKAGLGPV